jgi:hypothetical protein
MLRLILAISFSAWCSHVLAGNEELYGTYELVSSSVKYLDTNEIIPDVLGKNPRGSSCMATTAGC